MLVWCFGNVLYFVMPAKFSRFENGKTYDSVPSIEVFRVIGCLPLCYGKSDGVAERVTTRQKSRETAITPHDSLKHRCYALLYYHITAVM